MKIQTITTLELSSLCNLSCSYCINRLLVKHPNRKAGIMSDAVFERCVEIVKQLSDQGTQKELNLNGNGESLMDPQLIVRIEKLRSALGDDIHIQLSTNATLLTPQLAAGLKSAGIDRVDVSPHSVAAARMGVCYLLMNQVKGAINTGPIYISHNWAGQLEPENRIPLEPQGLSCQPLIEGRGYIQSEGDVVPCCYDYRNLGKIGTVFDEDILERELKPFELCQTCHQELPENDSSDLDNDSSR